MKNGTEAMILAVATFGAFLAAATAADDLFKAHAWVLFFVLAASTIILFRRVEFAPAGQSFPPKDTSGYMDEVIRYGAVATMFWGLVALLQAGNPLRPLR